MDNDIMFGKPSSQFRDLEAGIKSYKAGLVKSDLYLVQKPVSVDKHGQVNLQIKEIEPEVSAVFDVSLRRIAVKAGDEIFVTSDFSGCVKIDKSISDKIKQPKVIFRSKFDVTPRREFTLDKDGKFEPVLLNTGDSFELAFQTDSLDDHYLILESWYRDWVLGSVYSYEASEHFILSPYRRTIKSAGKGVLVGLFTLFMSYLGLPSLGAKYDDQNVRDTVASSFGLRLNVARADTPPSCTNSTNCTTPKSLELAYKDETGENTFEVVEPRYARPYAVAIKLPKEALVRGVASLKVTATKKHKVSALRIVKAERISDADFENMQLIKAFHHREKKDYATTLSVHSDSYLKTYPSDVISLSFTEAESSLTPDKENEYKYVLNVGGVYTAASKKDQAVVGDWVPKLDSEAKTFIADVYKDSFGKPLKFSDKA